MFLLIGVAVARSGTRVTRTLWAYLVLSGLTISHPHYPVLQGYFLDYIERTYGEGSVIAINKKLDGHRYSEDIFKTVTGHHVEALWKRYKQWLADDMPLKEKLEVHEPQEKA